MISSKIKGFFYPDTVVSGGPDYGLADIFVSTAEAFSNVKLSWRLYIRYTMN